MSLVPPRAAFQHPDFRRYIGSRLVSILGVQMESVAVGWQVYSLTRDPAALGLVGLLQFLPFILLALPGGHVADRCDRRVVLLCTHAVHALSALLLLAISLSGTQDVRLIYGVLVLFGAGRAFSSPAGGALVPLLVPREHFTNAVTWSSTSWQVATIAGPAAGGLLYGAGGAKAVYALSAALAAAAFAFVLSLSIRPGSRDSEPLTADSVLAGFRYVWSQKLLLGSISLDLFAVLLGGAVALLPIYAQDILKVGPWGLGLLRSAPAAGAAAMAVWLAFHPLQGRAGHKLFWGVGIFGVATVVFGLSRNTWLSLLALAVLGAADMVSVVVRATLEQLATPDAMRGRVSAVNGMFIGASNELGEFESGMTAKLLGTVPAVVAGGVGTLLVVAAWLRLFPQLRDVDRLEETRHAG
ncbi:MAG: MFS transporter [Deltaproteobacteria bacterium]|nr:MFS transporter [Deltaproteobacteria bacterium]